MKKMLFNIIIVVILSVATLLVFEGIYAVAQWDKFKGSVTYKTYERLAGRARKQETRAPWHGDESIRPEP